MALWGKAHASADNKPKYLPDNTNSDYDMHDAYATNSGWVMKAGSKATGNGNTSAAPEILVENFINALKNKFTINIKEVEVIKENVVFKVPNKLN